MRFLGIGDDNSLGDMYLQLQAAGHEVRVYVELPESREVLQGLIERTEHWGDELAWIREAGDEGIVVFETATMGPIQDRLRRDGFHVIGGSAFGDRLEGERAFAQQLLHDCGVPTAAYHGFTDYAAALRFLQDHPGRYVYKANDASAAATRNYVGECADGIDMRALLGLRAARWCSETNPNFILMQYLQGVEVGVGAYFNGERFLSPVCLDWEHKRFFPGDLGELTGEMGTVVTYRGADRIFDSTLARVAPRLRESGYCGYINLNTIINDDGLWPLKFTCRFGYPGFAICSALHRDRWDTILYRLAHRDDPGFRTDSGFAVGVVLTVPPFPYPYGYAELSKGMPIDLGGTSSPADREHFHFAEVAIADGELVTSGSTGYVMVVTGTGTSVEAAQQAAYARVRHVKLPNMRYRNDIGDKLVREDLMTLKRLDYLDHLPEAPIHRSDDAYRRDQSAA